MREVIPYTMMGKEFARFWLLLSQGWGHAGAFPGRGTDMEMELRTKACEERLRTVWPGEDKT